MLSCIYSLIHIIQNYNFKNKFYKFLYKMFKLFFKLKTIERFLLFTISILLLSQKVIWIALYMLRQ